MSYIYPRRPNEPRASDPVQLALCDAEDPFTHLDVERVALAMFHSYDSESALDWYEHRRRLEPEARRMLEEVQG